MCEKDNKRHALCAYIDQLEDKFRDERLFSEGASYSFDFRDNLTSFLGEFHLSAAALIEQANGDVEIAKRLVTTYAYGYFRGYFEGY